MFNLFKKNSSITNNWKEKAKKRRLRNVMLEKRNKELQKNRNKWKTKAKKYQDERNKLNEILKKNF